ncbi:MerR-like helix-turn-helix DNA binding domain protein [Gordonia phage Santhid]|uniref:MerR-like helix-turn-helix DNA binding domain protein n=1 Tax=Gordonia phage Santhid TaxID=2927281 RepID=A0AAE9KCZ9_9CAUD|nr:MerR-like helix-turn-helix DNA binding domain protein [Gordonia phage Santhid]UOK18048.1 MerR-like helix-turn-helix DNA binding domain protein [Gordonia phage Santhid]
MTANACACGRPAPNAYLCPTCTTALAHRLITVATLEEHLDTQLAGLNRGAARVGGTRNPSETPLAFEWTAADAGWVLRETLREWCADLTRTHRRRFTYVRYTYPHGYVGPLAADQSRVPAGYRARIADYAAWLAANATLIAADPRAHTIDDEVTSAIDNARTAIDRRIGRKFAGICEKCGADLWAAHNADTVECRDCAHSVERWRAEARINRRLDDCLMTARELVDVVRDRYGIDTNEKRIHDLAYRKRHPITPRGALGGRTLYRAGDVFARLLHPTPTRKRTRAGTPQV